MTVVSAPFGLPRLAILGGREMVSMETELAADVADTGSVDAGPVVLR